MKYGVSGNQHPYTIGDWNSVDANANGRYDIDAQQETTEHRMFNHKRAKARSLEYSQVISLTVA